MGSFGEEERWWGRLSHCPSVPGLGLSTVYVCGWEPAPSLEYLLRPSACRSPPLSYSVFCSLYGKLTPVCTRWAVYADTLPRGSCLHTVSLLLFESVSSLWLTPFYFHLKGGVPGGGVGTCSPVMMVNLMSPSHLHSGKVLHNLIEPRTQILNFWTMPKV